MTFLRTYWAYILWLFAIIGLAMVALEVTLIVAVIKFLSGLSKLLNLI